MNEIPMIHLWRGERVDKMDREALLEAFCGLADDYASLQRVNEIDRNMRAAFAKRRNERV